MFVIEILEKLFEFIKNFLVTDEETERLKQLSARKRIAIVIFIFLLVLIALYIQGYISGKFTPDITQVSLSEYSLNINTGDTGTLSATVLYSDNSLSNDVRWVSSNANIMQINNNGQYTALEEGNCTITAQASNRKSTKQAECTVTVSDPLEGYTISVRRTELENYVYIYVQPKDDLASDIKLYAKSPSGNIYCPPIDKNDLYYFYAETGVWTVYASLNSENGTYEAHKPEDFASIEINDVSATPEDAILAGLPLS